MIEIIDVGAGKFLGVRRIFARITLKLPKTFLGYFSCENFLMRPYFRWPKKSLQYDFEHHFFQIKARPAPFLPRFPCIFRGFSGILPGFSPNQNFWGCACNPCTPAFCTTYRNLWNCLGASNETTCLTVFFRCPSASTLICMKLSNVCANNSHSLVLEIENQQLSSRKVFGYSFILIQSKLDQ